MAGIGESAWRKPPFFNTPTAWLMLGLLNPYYEIVDANNERLLQLINEICDFLTSFKRICSCNASTEFFLLCYFIIRNDLNSDGQFMVG